MLFRASLVANWLLRFFSFTGRVTTSALGFLFSWFAIFITNGMAISLGLIVNLSLWTALLSVVRPRRTRCWCTTCGQSAPMNLIHIAWTHITFLLWFIPLSNMTVASFALYFGTRMYRLKNPIPRALGWSAWTPPLICFSRAR